MPRIPITLAFLCCALTSCATPTVHPKDADLADGTYKIIICDGNCQSDPKAVKGMLVLDRTRQAFSNESEAMKYLMRADSATFVPNYCYYFDPATSNSKETLLEHDIVSFGDISSDSSGITKIEFLLDSPDFRYVTAVESSNDDNFRGDWASSYAGDGGKVVKYQSTHIFGQRISEPDAAICFNAVRRHERSRLRDYCNETPAKTCEPGDRVNGP